MRLPHLDEQLLTVHTACEAPDLAEAVWGSIATTIYDEITRADKVVIDKIKVEMNIPPERYLEELTAFPMWMDFAHQIKGSPPIVQGAGDDRDVRRICLDTRLIDVPIARPCPTTTFGYDRAFPQDRAPPDCSATR